MVLKTDDVHLVRAAQLGDLYAFEELVRRHRTRIYRVALRMLANPADAEDAAQDAFLQCWSALPRFRAESSFSTWLVQIVTNRCLNMLRSRRAEAFAVPNVERPERSTEVVETRAELEALERALVGLTPEQRAPLVLREVEGLSYEEIAYVLEVTVPAVKGRIHRARLELVAAMRQWR
ncbi:MAG: sigma-70 family RNA polymerase sigma factor [Actinobacteria bacterium]|nr:sigma-70 family RNA polymerase sigma factor [Actinomycetota bacterium]